MDFDKISDEQLALYMQENNGAGIEVLIGRYQEPLLRYTRRLLGDTEMAEDAVQNTFISAYSNINSYKAGRPFSPWIYRIAHNKAINEIRTHNPIAGIEEALKIADPISADTISGHIDQKTLREVLDNHLDKLPIKYREPLVLRYFEERTYEDISDILRIPKSTVGVRIKRALDRLKLKVDENLKEFL